MALSQMLCQMMRCVLYTQWRMTRKNNCMISPSKKLPLAALGQHRMILLVLSKLLSLAEAAVVLVAALLMAEAAEAAVI